MKIVPIFYCSNMKEAIAFYTNILDFKLKYTDASDEDWVVDLINGDAELQLTSIEKNLHGFAVNVWVDEVDSLFEKYISRGLDASSKKVSPVHQGPLKQTWGTREFYVTDASGNTLRFCKADAKRH